MFVLLAGTVHWFNPERRLTMLLNVKKMKKHIAVFAVVVILVIASVGTAVSALAAEYKPNPAPDNLVTHENGSWVYDENGAGEIISIDEDKSLNEVQVSPNNIFPTNVSDKGSDTKEVQEQLNSTPHNENKIFRAGEGPVYKDYDLVANNQVVYFDTQDELKAHVKLIKERRANGINPYEGFEELYAHINFNHPFGYMVSK